MRPGAFLGRSPRWLDHDGMSRRDRGGVVLASFRSYGWSTVISCDVSKPSLPTNADAFQKRRLFLVIHDWIKVVEIRNPFRRA